MAKKCYLDRQEAIRQILKWNHILTVMEEKIAKGEEPLLETVIAQEQLRWKNMYNEITIGRKRKPKLRLIRSI